MASTRPEDAGPRVAGAAEVGRRISTHEAIGHVETSLVFEHHHRPQWPDYAEPEPATKATRKGKAKRSASSRGRLRG